ncbi:MAG: nickel-dependent lactate racemase [Aureliella sp.]
MGIELAYGRNGLSLELPTDVRVDVIRKPLMPTYDHPSQAVASTLDQSGLARRASGCTSACIVICDITRPVPNYLFLRPMIERLVRAGVDLEQIVVLIATGLHRPNLGAELEELVGDPWVTQNVRVLNHDARVLGNHIDLGITGTRGTPVRINKEFVEADLRIVTGLVEPHFMAGYSGGRKVIAPGIAHEDTIRTFHSGRFMADPAARNCNFEGNPLHEEQLEIVSKVGQVYALNTVVDEQRSLAFVNFGPVVESHHEAVEFVRQYCEIEVASRYRTVVTTAAGYPLDKTYYQTVKGMVGAMGILADGGNLVIASECSEGIGSAEYLDAQQRLIKMGPKAFLASLLEKPRADIDEWQTQMQLKPQFLGEVHLYSTGLSEQQYAWTGVQRVRDLTAKVEQLARLHPEEPIAVIPEGPYVVPVCASKT